MLISVENLFMQIDFESADSAKPRLELTYGNEGKWFFCFNKTFSIWTAKVFKKLQLTNWKDYSLLPAFWKATLTLGITVSYYFQKLQSNCSQGIKDFSILTPQIASIIYQAKQIQRQRHPNQ